MISIRSGGGQRRACWSAMSPPSPISRNGATLSGLVGEIWGRVLALVGVLSAALALVFDRVDARSAASQVWSPFVLVAGLLLVGLVADQDGLFSAAGRRLADAAPNGVALFAGATLLVAGVTALLNLDTSVVFLTPVLVYAARRRGQGEAALLVGCLLLSNAGSLLLPGSNLTNLIVLGHLHLSGGQFFAHMALPWLGAVALTGLVIALAERQSLRARPRADEPRGTGSEAKLASASSDPEPTTRILGLGSLGVLAVTVVVVALRNPALPVVGVGLLVIAARLVTRREDLDHVLGVLGLPVLVGLFGIALALGTLGRSWAGPATLLTHLDAVGTAVVAAVATVVVNNLPAAALLASRVPPHPYALLVGLNVGPNLFVTGSLAWILWWRTASSAGSTPPVRRAVVLGLVTVPLAMAAALGLLAVTGSL
jgi:arsenical pump membrane protein